ncbi:MAG TPA: glucuronate isomerase [Candidatus Brocadiia bacterium]|nr:glucuronate isomerase [Candidatus Brocadiia bacterium]
MAGQIAREKVAQTVREAMNTAPILDIHTHLYPPSFGGLLLWGVDELLTYHYLIAELFRAKPETTYDKFWKLGKTKQADMIWDALFIANSPVSEACRGVLTSLSRLGIDVSGRDLGRIRKWFAAQTVEGYVDKVFELSGVSAVVMTNNPFDDEEKPVWDAKPKIDKRFIPALRIDNLLNDWPGAQKKLAAWGYKVETALTKQTLEEIRRFLNEWADRMKPAYMAASLPPSFAYPEDSSRGIILDECVLAVAKQRGLPVGLMIGVKKLVNPDLRLAGDSLGKMDISALERLCLSNPRVRFLITLLSRENQHELCIVARKFANLTPFGCWWFLNNPSIIREMTAERIETLGLSCIPQHSDARVLDQLIYKWTHSRAVVGDVLAQKYEDMAATGWLPTRAEIERDVRKIVGGGLLNRY